MKATKETKVGRPPMKPTEKRMYTYAVRLTESENKQLQKITKSHKTTASEIIRSSITRFQALT
jgi:hypothetical protein